MPFDLDVVNWDIVNFSCNLELGGISEELPGFDAYSQTADVGDKTAFFVHPTIMFVHMSVIKLFRDLGLKSSLEITKMALL